jgi:hypothetical protein
MSEDIHAPHTQFQSYPIRFGSAVAENESLEGGGGIYRNSMLRGKGQGRAHSQVIILKMKKSSVKDN